MSRRLLPAVALLVALSGCGDQEGFRFAVHPTSGTITAKGKPVGGAFVRFHPVDPKALTLPAGQTGPEPLLTTQADAEGRFVMSTYLADDGMPAGDYVVTVTLQPGAAAGADDLENRDGRPAPAPARSRSSVGPRYADPSTSPLRAAIKPGPNVVDLALD